MDHPEELRTPSFYESRKTKIREMLRTGVVELGPTSGKATARSRRRRRSSSSSSSSGSSYR